MTWSMFRMTDMKTLRKLVGYTLYDRKRKNYITQKYNINYIVKWET